MTSALSLTGDLLGEAEALGLTPANGLDSGDQICQKLADDVGIGGLRKYLAWLSDSSASPSTRFFTKASVPYRRVDDVLVANDWTDLTDGEIEATITVYENGGMTGAGAYATWTGTNPDGSADAGGLFCNDWTSASVADQGRGGRWANTNTLWTFAGTRQCNRQRTAKDTRIDNTALLCFEQ